MRRVAIGASLALLLSGGANAGVAEWWCSETQMMSIRWDGIGFNEHTLCDVDNLPVSFGADGTWTSAASCRNVYVIAASGDTPETIQEVPIDGLTQVTLREATADAWILTTDLTDTEDRFRPCD